LLGIRVKFKRKIAMIKKEKAKSVKTGAKAKKGGKYVCDTCGMAVTVGQECCCDDCNITCCGEDMTLLASC
jgi:hypothetical protein